MILNHSPLIIASFFSILALILIVINYSIQKTTFISLLIGGAIILISFLFFYNPPLIPKNWHYLASLSTLLLMITFLNQLRNLAKPFLLFSASPFLLLELIFLFRISQSWVYTLFFFLLIFSSFIGIIAAFKKT